LTLKLYDTILMKRILYILGFLIFTTTSSIAQDDEGQGSKIRERMTEYIQKRLSLSKAEAERFGPVFLDYFNELRKTNQEYKGDRLVLQQKIVELRLNYRNQFKTIVGERKSNDVFVYEREFINEIKAIRNERSQNKGGRNKRF
jgi:hypothetical protein